MSYPGGPDGPSVAGPEVTGPYVTGPAAIGQSDGPPVTGPHLIREVHPGLAGAVGSLWLAVTRAGGAIGFTRDAPEPAVRAAAEVAVGDVRAGFEHLLALGSGQAVVGTVSVVPGPSRVSAHRGTVVRLMVHPDLHGRGWGGRLLDAVVAHSRSLGLEQLLLSARSGTPLPAYYAARGWTEVGRWPGAVRVGPGDDRDEVWFQLRI